MERNGVGALLMRRPANFAWYTGGADNRVNLTSSLGVASVLVTRENDYVIASNIEAGRMRDEQTPDFEVLEHAWYESPSAVIEEAAGGRSLGADHSLEGAADLSGEISPLRYVLDTEAMDRYRRVGADATSAMEEAVTSLRPEADEDDATTSLVAACRRRKLSTPVAIVAGASRIPRYRHPIPHGERLGNRAMIVVCAERGGLYANLTRIVDFEGRDEELESRQRVCDDILKKMREATRVGRTLSSVFEDCREFYADSGFPREWELHHQGGLTGYAPREMLATPETEIDIETGMAFAWNPSITGAKAEETFVLAGSGPEIIAS